MTDLRAAREALREYRAEAGLDDAADWITAELLIADALRLIAAEHSAGILAARRVAADAVAASGIRMVALLDKGADR